LLKRWEERHDLALEALHKALEPADLYKVLSVKTTPLQSGLISKTNMQSPLTSNTEFQALRKDPKTPMNEHIDKFNMLLQAVNYNRPPEIPELSTAAVNLYFLQSLGTDWEVWGMAKGETLRRTPTEELMAEVRALARGKSGSSQSASSQGD
jgi:hypothetical protein